MQIEEILTRGVAEVIEKDHLEKALGSGRKLRVKLGIDPTSPNIHIGRAVLLWKLRAFQELGHKAVFIVGDFTGLIGDTSDKDAERPMMSEADVKKNMKTYFAQAFKILDKNKTETHYNSEWLKNLGFIEMAKMANLFGLHEFESREVVARRMKAGKRESFHELLYPLLQGYDSAAVKADVELGGTDQRFNLLTGRRIQPLYGQKPQDIVMMALLEGLDGRKMSSSWGNVVNITDEPSEMFGKIMSLRDELIQKYLLLCTQLPPVEIEMIQKGLSSPRSLKARLAREIVTLYHGNKAADLAEKNFESKFGKTRGEVVPDYTLKKKPGEYEIVSILVEGKLAASNSEASRKIAEGAVEVGGTKITDESAKVKLAKGSLVRLGKRFLKIE